VANYRTTLEATMKKTFNFLISAAGVFLAGCTQISSVPLAGNFVPSAKEATAAGSNPKALRNADALCWPKPDELSAFAALPPLDLWDRIREGFAIPEQHNKRIEQELRWYAKHPSYMARVSERGLPYLYHIVEELEARGMPMEFALLPIVESAFDPFAYSHGRASGMWQFVPGTGKALGLKQNWWYDGRRDVTASTDAALLYLERLAKAFDGDWLLALAAYNGGRGNVSKAIRRNKAAGKPTDYWSLNLPRETEAYVPRLLALKALVSTPEKYNLAFKSIPNQPFFEIVDIEAQIDLAQAAALAEMSMEDFYLLNPAFNRWATDPHGPHHLLVPVDRAASFRENLAALPKDQRVTWDRYTIKSGDTLSTIAADYKTSVSALQAVNKLHSNRIRKGDVLLVPVATKDVDHYTLSAAQRLKAQQAKVAERAKGNQVNYEVKAGDSFWTISRRYKVSVREVAKWNGMAPGDPLKIGQKLVIWSKEAASSPTHSQGVVRKVAYRVRQGDSLYRIANRFRVSVQDIQRWNELNPTAYLQPGQALTLFVDVTGH
jgi:membrane-bound lytic murein transglycosylase D